MSAESGRIQVVCAVGVELARDVSSMMRVQVLPWGRFESNTPHGAVVSTHVDFETVAMLNRAFDNAHRSRGVDLLLDYEHQSVGMNRRTDGLAPASGWMRHNSAGFIGIPGDGVYVDVEWTPTALRHIANREYRYLSIQGLVREIDGRIDSVQSVGLVNAPKAGVKPIVNRNKSNERNENMSGALSVATANRMAVINSAGKEWDSETTLQGVTTRERIINQALRDAGMPPMDEAEHNQLTEGDSSRTAVINRAIAEFDGGGRSLTALTNKRAFVQNALRDAGKRELSDAELRVI